MQVAWHFHHLTNSNLYYTLLDLVIESSSHDSSLVIPFLENAHKQNQQRFTSKSKLESYQAAAVTWMEKMPRTEAIKAADRISK